MQRASLFQTSCFIDINIFYLATHAKRFSDQIRAQRFPCFYHPVTQQRFTGSTNIAVGVYDFFPFATQSSKDSTMEALEGLFQLTSGAWILLVVPPGTVTKSTDSFFAACFTSAMWHL